VINVPTHDIIRKVIAIGNSTGSEIDKFKAFKLTPEKASKVKAPLISECYANFECKLVDTSLIKKYSLFVFEVVKAHAVVSPRFPRTIHYRGEGRFMVSGKEVDYARYFKPEML
jgi:flavin reductase (DIM6/NTAB) family NADH-FMN oxidoreductase RutF